MVRYVQSEKYAALERTLSELAERRLVDGVFDTPFVKEMSISNFRCFPANNKNDAFKISFNIPKDNKPGSGLTVLVGENNSGKSTVLRAIGLFSFNDKDLDDMSAKHELNASHVDDPSKGAKVHLYTDKDECYLKTINSDEKLEWECDNKTLKETFKCKIIPNLLKPDWILNGMLAKSDMNHLIYGSSCITPECPHAEKTFGSKIQYRNRRDGEDYLVEKTSCGRSIPARQLGSGDRQFRHITNNIKDDYESSTKEDVYRLFLLDEPETHLHPKAVQALVDVLWKASARVQIILASHSPVLIEAVYNKIRIAYDEAERIFFEKKKSNGEKSASSLFASLFSISNPFVSLNRVSEPEHGRKPEDYFRILSKNSETGTIRSQSAKPFLLNPVPADEINYCAFDYPTAFYFIQLSGKLKEQL